MTFTRTGSVIVIISVREGSVRPIRGVCISESLMTRKGVRVMKRSVTLLILQDSLCPFATSVIVSNWQELTHARLLQVGEKRTVFYLADVLSQFLVWCRTLIHLSLCSCSSSPRRYVRRQHSIAYFSCNARAGSETNLIGRGCGSEPGWSRARLETIKEG